VLLPERARAVGCLRGAAFGGERLDGEHLALFLELAPRERPAVLFRGGERAGGVASGEGGARPVDERALAREGGVAIGGR
jgi:hypothetical protein